MNKSAKVIIATIVILAIAVGAVFALDKIFPSLGLIKRKQSGEEGKLKIVVTSFSCYDFSKQITGENAEVVYLLKPGEDSHSFSPSNSDFIQIKEADVFIYIGGEAEQWVDRAIEAGTISSSETKIVRAADCIETQEEEEIDGAEEEAVEEEEGSFDEHIWTSPTNAIKMVNYLAKNYEELDPDNKEVYEVNAKNYVAQIEDVRAKIQEIVDNKKRSRLVFGDKMPMQYFIKEFNLEVSAAFNGCSTETTPSAKTMAYLMNKVKEENIPVVLYIELSPEDTAKTIADASGAEAMQIQTLHNISKDDFDNGETYVSLMNRNLDVLRKALQ